jgi:hypothetical protein
MSRSIRKETSSLAFGIVGRFGGSSAGFVVAALNAASAASRDVVVLRVLSAGIYVFPLRLHFLKRQLGARHLGQVRFTLAMSAHPVLRSASAVSAPPTVWVGRVRCGTCNAPPSVRLARRVLAQVLRRQARVPWRRRARFLSAVAC